MTYGITLLEFSTGLPGAKKLWLNGTPTTPYGKIIPPGVATASESIFVLRVGRLEAPGSSMCRSTVAWYRIFAVRTNTLGLTAVIVSWFRFVEPACAGAKQG